MFVSHRKISREGSREGELEDLYEDESFTESNDWSDTFRLKQQEAAVKLVFALFIGPFSNSLFLLLFIACCALMQTILIHLCAEDFEIRLVLIALSVQQTE